MSRVRPVKISIRSESRWKTLWTSRISTRAIGFSLKEQLIVTLSGAKGTMPDHILRRRLSPASCLRLSTPRPAACSPPDSPERISRNPPLTGPACTAARLELAVPDQPHDALAFTSRTAAAGIRNRGGPAGAAVSRRSQPSRLEKVHPRAHLRQDPGIAVEDAHLHLDRGPLPVGGGDDLPDLAAERGVGIGVERDRGGPVSPPGAIYASFTSTSTSSVVRSAIVTTAPRVSPPPTDGATTSPISASFRSTVPVNGARMTVFSRLACANRRFASAASSLASAAASRAAACLARPSTASRSCSDTRSAFSWRMFRSRSASRAATSLAVRASTSSARRWQRQLSPEPPGPGSRRSRVWR